MGQATVHRRARPATAYARAVSEPHRLPLFAFGNVAQGVIAVGNVAHGVIAIGFTVAVGVVAIGMNAVGAIAIGMNAIGPLTVALINGLGVWGWAGVNLIAGGGGAMVNAGLTPIVGFAAAAVMAIVAEGVVRSTTGRPPTPRPPLADLLTASPGTYPVLATVVRDGDRWTLFDGDQGVDAEVDVDQVWAVAAAATRGRPCQCEVRVAERFAEDGDYRNPPTTEHRLIVVAVRRAARRWLTTTGELLWFEARAFQVGAVASAAAVALG